MNFEHYTDQPVTLAVDLVNSFGWVSKTEHLNSAEDLSDLLDGSPDGLAAVMPAPRDTDVPAVRRLRDRLRAVFEAADPAEAAAIINEVLVDSGAVPRLSVHAGPPHLHFQPADGSLADWLGVFTAMGLAAVLAEGGLDRLGICQSETCDDAFVDSSRNRSRRHCSTTCGTREHVSAHRQRKRQEGGEGI